MRRRPRLGPKNSTNAKLRPPGLTLPAVFEGFNSYNNILRKIAIQGGTGILDSASLVPHEGEYFVDRMHFSKEGAELMV